MQKRFIIQLKLYIKITIYINTFRHRNFFSTYKLGLSPAEQVSQVSTRCAGLVWAAGVSGGSVRGADGARGTVSTSDAASDTTANAAAGETAADATTRDTATNAGTTESTADTTADTTANTTANTTSDSTTTDGTTLLLGLVLDEVYFGL